MKIVASIVSKEAIIEIKCKRLKAELSAKHSIAALENLKE